MCYGSTGSITVTPIGGTAPYRYRWTNILSRNYSVSDLAAGTYSVTVQDDCGAKFFSNYRITQPLPILLIPTQVNVACNGKHSGSATVYAEGGTRPYHYQWSNGATTTTISDLAAGDYSVVVTDANGCSQIMNYTISEPAPLSVASEIVPATCPGGNDGSVSLSIAGGTDRYQFSWNPSTAGIGSSVSHLKAGTYSVIVTDAEWCSQLRTYTVSQPDAIVITPTQVNVECHGGSTGSASVTVTGGTPADSDAKYTFLWPHNGATSAGVTGLSAGIYTVMVTDGAGCVKNKTFTITEPELLTVALSAANVSCNGGSTGSVAATVTGGTGSVTYEWSENAKTESTSRATGLAAGTYSVKVTDENKCQATQSVTVSQPTLMVVTNSVVDVKCGGDLSGSISLEVNGGTPSYTYSWSNKASTSSISNVAAGKYSVAVSDANQCTQNFDLTIAEPQALQVEVVANDNVCNAASAGNASVIVSGGTPQYTFSWFNNATSQSVQALAAGQYNVVVSDANSCSKTVTFSIFEPAVYCQNGGQCAGLKQCVCPTGWTGDNCTIAVCSQECLNGGNCTAPDTCTCTSDFVGNSCNYTAAVHTVKYVVRVGLSVPEDSTVNVDQYASLIATELNINKSSIAYSQSTKRAAQTKYTLDVTMDNSTAKHKADAKVCFLSPKII